MLAAGDLDAVISARAPSCYIESHPGVTRLFEDFQKAEQEYFRRTRIFPIMHALGIRNDVAAKHPWMAASLYKAFLDRLIRKDLTAFDAYTDEMMDREAGFGGHEGRTWVAAAAAMLAAGPFEMTLGYYRIILEWITGMAVVRGAPAE